MESTQAELLILQSISSNKQALRQRDLARIVGLSLGMTNAILKRLARKGWLSIRKINNRNISYLMTPAGLEKVAQRSYRYLRRTIGNIVRYREAIEILLDEAIARGARGVVLLGVSDLEISVEHLCQKRGIPYQWKSRADGGEVPQRWFVIHAEGKAPRGRRDRHEDSMRAYLLEVLGRAGAPAPEEEA